LFAKRREEGALSPIKTPCPTKRALLYEYLRKTDIVAAMTREYVEAVACGSTLIVLAAMKDRLAGAKVECKDARKEYADHCEAHTC
jgi:hypothetical protein